MSSYEIISPEEIEIIGVLGSGGNGRVYSAKWKNEIVAVKEICADENVSVEDLCKEAEVQKRAENSYNISVVHGVCMLDNRTIWIVMEQIANGDLYGYLKSRQQPLPLSNQISLCESAARAVSALHSASPPILHRDLKSFNFLLESKTFLILTDFGMARPTSNVGKTIGTLAWTPPEILRGTSEWTTASDIFSLGMVFYEIVSRQMPFSNIDDNEVIKQLIISGKRPQFPPDCHKELRAIIQSCWVDNPRERPDASGLLLRLKQLEARTSAIKPLAGSPEFAFYMVDLLLAFAFRTLNKGRAVQHINPETINDIVDGEGNTSLQLAVRYGELEAVKELIRLGADVNATNLPGYTPLTIAVRYNYIEAIPLLIGAGANLEHHTGGRTALLLACDFGYHTVVKMLLEYGADVSGRKQNNPIRQAIYSGSVDIIHLLLQHGAILEPDSLLVAATNGHPEVMDELVKLGLSVNDYINGTPILHQSLKSGLRTVQKLLDLGAEVNATCHKGFTALFIGVVHAQEEPLELLVKYGANLEAKWKGITALAWTAIIGNVRLCRILLDLGADLRTRQTQDRCILAEGINVSGRPEILELLIQRGADVDHPDCHGITPIMLAARKGSMECVEVLLRYWPPNRIDSLKFALHVALQTNLYDVMGAIMNRILQESPEARNIARGFFDEMKSLVEESQVKESEEDELNRAISMSLETDESGIDDSEAELERAIKMSLAPNCVEMESSDALQKVESVQDEELEMAIAMSLTPHAVQ